MKRMLACLISAATVLGATSQLPAARAGTGKDGSTARKQFVPEPIAWTSCSNESLKQAEAECGLLSVPLDHRKPHGKIIQVAVSRIRHTSPDSQYQGVLLANPGGPGGSGLDLWTSVGDRLVKGVGAKYDLIGFDPRGIGASRPALACDGEYFHYNRPDYRPTDPAVVKVWLARSKKYAEDCRAHGGALLEHLKTVDTVRDMDILREALAVDRITFYGFSYGTYLGQVYATLFPNRVRRMVLDSNMDPRKGYFEANLDQLVPFDRNMQAFYDWIGRNDETFHLGVDGRSVAKLVASERNRLKQAPAETT
jgi:pimeloyl-ACP methyl ester carboxylesterase